MVIDINQLVVIIPHVDTFSELASHNEQSRSKPQSSLVFRNLNDLILSRTLIKI